MILARTLVRALLIAQVVRVSAVEAQRIDADSLPCDRRIEVGSPAVSQVRRSLQRALGVLSKSQRSDLFRASSQRFVSCAPDRALLERWLRPVAERTIEPLALQVSAVRNSSYPRTVNDGGAWQGVGWTVAATGGLRAQWRFLELSLAPEVFHQENKDHLFVPSTASDRSQFAHPYQLLIDYPKRFGLESWSKVQPGQSYLKATAGPIAAAFSTENLWIGGAQVYPLVLSHTASGFPHVRIGTQKPIDLWVLDLEFQLLFASLKESDFFDNNPANNEHYFATTMLVVQPHFLPGLYLGVVRALHDIEEPTGQSLGFYLSRIADTPFGGTAGGNPAGGNAIGVLLGRWVLPESGFEVYAEWGREDTPGGWTDILREPDWTQAYALGIQKVYTKPKQLVRFYAELIHLGESSPARAGRGFSSFYTHGEIFQGHTNEGQLLGAAIGPGSDAQLIGVEVFYPSGRSEFRVERTRYDDDTYLRSFARRYGETRHDAEINLSAGQTYFLGSLELEAGLMYSRRYGRDFIPLGGFGNPDIIENNWNVRVGASWRPPF
jgi:hypothetical protein